MVVVWIQLDYSTVRNYPVQKLDHCSVTALEYNVHLWVFINFPHSHQRSQVGLYSRPELDYLPVTKLIIFTSQSWNTYVQCFPVTKLDYLHVTRLDCLSVTKFDLFIYKQYRYLYTYSIYVYTYVRTILVYRWSAYIYIYMCTVYSICIVCCLFGVSVAPGVPSVPSVPGAPSVYGAPGVRLLCLQYVRTVVWCAWCA